MNKFGLIDPADEPEADPESSISARLASFPPVAPRKVLDLAAVDAAAAPHGFVSRESIPAASPTIRRNRRRQIEQPKRQLSIRLTDSQYDRFLSYADRHKLTYHDALDRLLDGAID